MSALSMFKVCGNCGRRIRYDPGVGDMGIICHYCKRPADISAKGSLLSEVRKLLNKIRET